MKYLEGRLYERNSNVLNDHLTQFIVDISDDEHAAEEELSSDE